jgi:Zn-dependent peptidase ImmA (M78 family)/DNA-binding XRE family transcriptional regulator
MKVGDKVLQIRKEHRVSKLRFSKLVDVNRITLEKIEKNQVPPSFKVIEALCKNYGIPISYFDPSEIDLSEVVYRSAKPIQLSDRDYNKVIHSIESYVLLENLVGVQIQTEFPLMYPVREYNETLINHAAKMCRNILGTGVAPILNLYDLLENMGIHIVSLELSDESIDGFSLYLQSQGLFIFLNKETTEERKVFTLAHELGHLVCHRDAYRFSIEKGKNSPKTEEPTLELGEKIVNSFAANFLISQEYVLQLIKSLNIRDDDWDLSLIIELKSRFKVSAESLVNRFFNLEIINRTTWESIRKDILEYYKKNKNTEPGGVDHSVIPFENQRFINLVYIARKRKADKELKKILTLFPEKITV